MLLRVMRSLSGLGEGKLSSLGRSEKHLGSHLNAETVFQAEQPRRSSVGGAGFQRSGSQGGG